MTLTTSPKHAVVFGGTGFLGRSIIKRLAADGWVVSVPTRSPAKAYELRVLGTVGQIVPMTFSLHDTAALARILEGADAVINLIGELAPKGGAKGFCAVHHEWPNRLAKAAAKARITRFVHISALGADSQAPSAYLRSKASGEQAVLSHCPTATILRPSIVFGAGDGFFSLFRMLSRISPILPLVGGGHTKFQPVYVGDVADAVHKIITHQGSARTADHGTVYTLAGPEVLTFRQMLERLQTYAKIKRILFPMPWWMARMNASVLQYLPGKLLTPDQVASLRVDNVAAPDDHDLETLEVTPTPMAAVMPDVLA